jgi:hypothetical protein
VNRAFSSIVAVLGLALHTKSQLMHDEDPHHHIHHHQQLVAASPVEVAASATSHALPHSLLARMPNTFNAAAATDNFLRNSDACYAGVMQQNAGAVALQALHCYTVAAFTGGVGGVSEAMDAELDATGQVLPAAAAAAAASAADSLLAEGVVQGASHEQRALAARHGLIC